MTQITGTRAAQMLGYAGLIPFAAFALDDAALGMFGAFSEDALLAYGAVILSFLGGILWGRGVGMGDARSFAISVLPSLAGWAALLIGGSLGLLLCAGGFALMLAHDLRDHLPSWFAQLRLHLSIGAIVACLVGALA